MGVTKRDGRGFTTTGVFVARARRGLASLAVGAALRALSTALSAPFALSALSAQSPPSVTTLGFHLTEVAPHVYAAIRTEPGRNIVNGNSTIIVNDSDVIVVDATGTPASAKELIAAIRRVTSNPVSFLITTHWHDDHVMGNQAFAEAFPGIQFVAHPATRDSMTTIAMRNRERYLKDLEPYMDYLDQRLTEGQGGKPLTPAERESMESDLRLGRRYLSEAPRFRVILPTLMVVDQVTLKRGRRTIQILHLGRGNTAGDLVVYLPNERVVATGDLVVYPTPYVFDSYPAEWVACLDKLKELKARILIPGHGPVLRDYRYPDLVAEALRSVVAQAGRAVAQGLDLDSVRKVVDLERFRRAFAGEDPLRNVEWANYFVYPVVGRAVESAVTR